MEIDMSTLWLNGEESKTVTRKHIAERQRRARINSYLAEIQTLTDGESQPSAPVKLEKVEVLERAVAYMNSLNEPDAAHLDDNNNSSYSDGTENYRRGFESCMTTLLDNTAVTGELKSETEGLKSHLISFIDNLTSQGETMASSDFCTVQQVQHQKHQQGLQGQQQLLQQQQMKQQQIQQQQQQHIHNMQLMQQQQLQQLTMAHAQFQNSDQSNCRGQNYSNGYVAPITAIHSPHSSQNGGYPTSDQEYQNYQMYSQTIYNYPNQMAQIPEAKTQSPVSCIHENIQNSNQHTKGSKHCDYSVNKGKTHSTSRTLSPAPRTRCFGDTNVTSEHQKEHMSQHSGAIGEMKTMLSLFEGYMTSDKSTDADVGTFPQRVPETGLLQIATRNRATPDHMTDSDSSDSAMSNSAEQLDSINSKVKSINNRPSVSAERVVSTNVWRPWQ